MDFLEEEDEVRKDEVDAVSFSELLNFCSRAQSLISELLLLSGRIPSHFLDRRYHPILFDLRYFESPDDFDMRIEGNSELEALEDQLRESCSEFMQRFFLLANGIVSYYQELLMYLNDLQEGVNVQSTLERVMENESGRQLLMESITLFGCLLLLLEHCLGGSLREKLLVSYVRHSCCFDDPNLDKISSLCRMHLGHGPLRQVHLSSMISVTKAEDLFARFPFPKQVVEAVICRLRDDDLYNRVRHYSDPEHQTVSLGAQGACLYIMLFFSPDLLQNVFVMHEIVERFFKDCWVIPIFLQFTVDLLSSWDAYKAAKTSLSSCLSAASVRDISQFHCTKVKGLLLELGSVLLDGIMTRDYVLRNSQSLVSLVRNCNVSLRWLLLHRSSIDKKLREVVTSVGTAHQVEEDTLLMLLFKTSQLEFMLKQFYVELLDGKETLWLESRSHALACMRELSEYFSRLPALTWKIKDEDLMKWFTKLSTEVHSINYMQTGSACRKIHHVISLLKEVEQFHQVDENSQIKRHLFGIQNYLQDMLRILNLHQKTLFSLSVIADVSYAWEFVGHYDGLLKMIEKDLSIVLNLHSFILKFRSILETPLMHIIQAHSQDHFSVSDHYSLEYVARVCKTLEIIPAMLFRILNDVVSTLQPSHFWNRIERDKLQDLMQLDQQFSLAKAGNSISMITKGIQIMSKSFRGLINLDMKNWLEKEIRKEFSKQVKDKLTSLFSSPNVGLEELETRLKIMKDYVLSQLQLAECFQDLIHIHLHRVWEEEFSCILKHSVQDEFDNYVRKGKHDSGVGPLKLNDFSMSKTFLGHLLHHMLHLSNPSCSMYIEPMSGWFDADGHELLGLRFFDLFESCIGPFGMACIDSLLTFLITDHLEHMTRVSNYLVSFITSHPCDACTDLVCLGGQILIK